MIGADIITLLVDAYVEKIVEHLWEGYQDGNILFIYWEMVSTLPLSLFLVIKININADGISLTENFQQIRNYQIFKIIALNLLPGAIIISLIHIMVYIPKFKYYFEKIQFKCCQKILFKTSQYCIITIKH